MSEKTLVQKLLIKSGFQCAVINPPDGYMDRLAPLPEGITVIHELQGSEALDFVHLFAANRAVLDRDMPEVLAALKDDGLLWISYPKRSANVETDLTRDTGWGMVKSAGFQPVTQVAIDDVWSALRFRPAEKVGK